MGDRMSYIPLPDTRTLAEPRIPASFEFTETDSNGIPLEFTFEDSDGLD